MLYNRKFMVSSDRWISYNWLVMLLLATLAAAAAEVEESLSASEEYSNEDQRSMKLQDRYTQFHDHSLVPMVNQLSRTWNFIKDPLHAYPDAADIKVHEIFQKATVFEINNSVLVRRVLTFLKVVLIAKAITLGLLAVIVVGGVIIAALPLAISLGRRRRRRSLSSSSSSSSIDWDQFSQLASQVLDAIESAQVRYEQ